MQNGAKSSDGLWHTSKDPPAVCVAKVSPVVVVGAEPSVVVAAAVAVCAAGEALNVVATPFIVVRTGVTVDPLPLASTVTQASLYQTEKRVYQQLWKLYFLMLYQPIAVSILLTMLNSGLVLNVDHFSGSVQELKLSWNLKQH